MERRRKRRRRRKIRRSKGEKLSVEIDFRFTSSKNDFRFPRRGDDSITRRKERRRMRRRARSCPSNRSCACASAQSHACASARRRRRRRRCLGGYERVSGVDDGGIEVVLMVFQGDLMVYTMLVLMLMLMLMIWS